MSVGRSVGDAALLLSGWLQRANHRLDTGLRKAAIAVLRRRGWTPAVLAHPGYGSARRVRVLGRVLWAAPSAHPENRVGIPGWQRFLTLEAPHTEVEVEVAGVHHRVRSDEDGFVDTIVEIPDGLDGQAEVAVTLRAADRTSTAPAYLASADAQRGVVCDIDDTVLVTELAHPLRALWRTFVQTSAQRRAVPGMAALLHELTTGGQVPVIYLSTGPWNLVAPLARFLHRTGFPPGALLLTDWGVRADCWFRDGRAHKRNSLARLAIDLPEVSWTLVGDTGQHDPLLYAEFATTHPDQVARILLRDPGSREPLVDTAGAVPVVRAADGAGLRRGLLRFSDP